MAPVLVDPGRVVPGGAGGAAPDDRRGPERGRGVRREPRPLTARQEAVLAVIRSSLSERGRGPTVREIGARVGLSSTSSVAHQLGRLEARGLIVRTGRDWSTCVLGEERPARRPGLRSRGPDGGVDGYGRRPAP
ncbi:MarR family transcriptional regulator [Streptomyces sp. gb14]|uniref:LexA family protein n=1 Tax=Streptomyces sp. gb14 TaxID=1827753 RepID=UPI00211D8E9F|nr:MarR family transcriptional regulator [Streptomyces sp. gb14]